MFLNGLKTGEERMKAVIEKIQETSPLEPDENKKYNTLK